MGIIRKQSSINTILTYIGFGIGFINVILLYPKLLTKEEFGLTRLFIELGDITTGVILFGVPSVIIRFFPYYKKNKDNDLLSVGLFFCTLTLTVCFALIFIFRDTIVARYCTDSALFAEYYYLVFIIIFFNVYLLIFNHYTIANEETIIGIIGQQVINRLFPLILLLFFALGFINFHIFIYLFTFNSFVQLIVLLAFMKAKNLLHFNFNISATTRSFLKPMTIYGLSIYVVLVVEILAQSIQVLTISHLHGIGNTAVYTVASYIAQIIQIPQRSIAVIALPIFAKSWAEDDFANINMVFKKSSLNLTILGVFLFLVINSNLHNIFNIVGQDYHDGINICILMSFAYIIDLAFGLNNEIITTSRYWRFNSITHIFLLAMLIPTNYYFIKLFGINGAAYSLIISLLIYNSWRTLFLYKKHKLFPFSMTHFILVLYGGVVFMVTKWIPDLNIIKDNVIINNLIPIIIKSGFIFITFLVPIYFLKVSEDLNNMIDSLLRR